MATHTAKLLQFGEGPQVRDGRYPRLYRVQWDDTPVDIEVATGHLILHPAGVLVMHKVGPLGGVSNSRILMVNAGRSVGLCRTMAHAAMKRGVAICLGVRS